MLNDFFRKKSISDIVAHSTSSSEGGGLKKVLGVKDLTALGVAAIIGAGIFSSIGKASYEGGPAVIFLYIFTALACGFAAMCYAEFAASVPVSGSAYTYAYVAFGELIAWVIGWCLIMEYAIGNIACAISWSDYCTGLLSKTPFAVPHWMSMDYWTAQEGYATTQALLAGGEQLLSLEPRLQEAYTAWVQAPTLAGLRIIMDVPAFIIVFVITAIVFVGIRESKKANNIFVFLKLAVIFLVIVVGSFYINPENWSPFAPNGLVGVLKGVSAVFFAYIGFDAISTTAEECKDPQKDLPKAMMYSLVICAVLYVLVALVLTGMVHYSQLKVGDPLAMVFDQNGLYTIGVIVALSAVVATASVMLVFQIGQPRIWMAMGRDGLLPKKFAQLHPKWQTPTFATLVTGLLVGIPSLFMNLDLVISLTSIGTLFAFVIVCGGVLVLQKQPNRPHVKFKVPYLNSKYIIPVMLLVAVGLIERFVPNYFTELFLDNELLQNIPMILFWVAALLLTLLCIKNSYSLIPVLGILSCLYLMAQEEISNWIGFGVWLLIGLVLYFSYGFWKSKLRKVKHVQ
jgi:APA family basic amino acid/polyamine antiporter